MGKRTRLWILFVSYAVITCIFLVTIRRSTVGPGPTAPEVTDAVVDRDEGLLYVVLGDRYGVVEMDTAVEANGTFEDTIRPRGGNMLRWTWFDELPLPEKVTSNGEPVALMRTYASFLYHHDGRASLNHTERAEIPGGYTYALYESESAYPEKSRKDWYPSFILVTGEAMADGRHGVQFFYNPGNRYAPALRHPVELILFSGSYIGLLVAIGVTLSSLGLVGTIVGYGAATLLHLASTTLIFLLLSMGDAWSGTHEGGSMAIMMVVLGTLILLSLVTIRILPKIPGKIAGR